MSTGERYVVLGLAHPRAPWFRSVARWSTAGSVPVEFVKCMSPAELRARLSSGRPFSAVLADASSPALDRDLVELAAAAGSPVIALCDRPRDLTTIGVSGALPWELQPHELLDALAATRLIAAADDLPGDQRDEPDRPWRGRVATVCGAGGTGSSTAAIALAQGLADDIRNADSVVLADLALHAEQAMLHDADDIVPGVQELVDAHRTGRPSAEAVRSLTFAVDERHYHLLLGIRRARAWSALRPRAFAAAFDSLRRTHRVVVCDSDAEVEGEAECGSLDVEERHLMARTAVSQGDVVFAVGLPGVKGTHALVRVLSELLAFGVPADRLVPVVNRAPRQPRARAEITSALAALMPRRHGSLCSTVFLPEKRLEAVLLGGGRMPPALSDPLAGAFRAVLARNGSREAAPPTHRPVVPGSLSTWEPAGDDPAGEPESAAG